MLIYSLIILYLISEKDFEKNVAAQRLISLKTYDTYSFGEDKAKNLLKNLINKIIDSEHIEDKYKKKIKEIYREFCKPNNLSSFEKI